MATKKTVGTPKKVAAPAAAPVARTEVRNSPLPKAASRPIAQAPVKQITHEMIQLRAYEIWQREGGSEYDNWCRAERELRGA